MDDDVVPAPDCLEALLAHDGPCPDGGPRGPRRPARREGGGPLRPAQPALDPAQDGQRGVDYGDRAAMPERCRSRWSRSRGSWSTATWWRRSGCRTRRTSSSTTTPTSPSAPGGPASRSWPLRDAVLVRQLDFDQQHALDSWKGYYMYRNLFVVHFRYGENPLVRLKPWLSPRRWSLSPLRGGRAEARNVIRAIWSARKMKKPPGGLDGSTTETPRTVD